MFDRLDQITLASLVQGKLPVEFDFQGQNS